MSSNLLLLFLFFLIGCGVKGDPVAPKNANLPSFMENYQDVDVTESQKTDLNRKKKR